MSIPISIFLAVWAVFMLVFLAAAFLSVYQMKRFAIRGKGATLPTALFMGVSGIVMIVTILYLLTVDWNQALRIGAFGATSPYLPL